MADTTRDSDRILKEARTSLAVQREGGTHRPAKSIGKGSAQAKMKHLIRRGAWLAAALVAIFVATGVIGAIVGGIGFWGVMALALAVIVAVGVFALAPAPKPPKRSELKLGNPQQMVERTELWLEAQRPALPPPAVRLVDQLGVQLDALGLQLETIDAAHPAMAEVRELVGEYIPETIENYRKIPEHLRGEEHAGKTADERLSESLARLSGEVERVTRRLAEGALDDLAVKSRYLDYRYGGDGLLSDMRGDPDTNGTPLPAPSIATREKSKS
ncbi:hypothetical protein [Erythrobacter sp. HL-111]|uniref:hypothetical protein n=1 Tax=Erythrobacter sp. HL-111 TaxID=1798193 RepID=UPI0006DBAD67|nr:hypothetical protein [Erythrobacter sp. HL-111]KPP86741.1 MAG: Protein of unknown function (DUF1469) [Erythrobacteraceae bacterium HL-111]SDS98525.1 hypothetical protein SAMN04515621_2656 [Erythrobacter sp. HL-111]